MTTEASPTLVKILSAREVLLHQPEVRADALQVARLLHEDFQEIGRSGTHYSRSAIIALLSAEQQNPAKQHIWSQAFKVTCLSIDLALVTYQSAMRVGNAQASDFTLRSSLWQLTDAGWRLRFHQGTPTEPFVLQR